jgi:hypothetical protein
VEIAGVKDLTLWMVLPKWHSDACMRVATRDVNWSPAQHLQQQDEQQLSKSRRKVDAFHRTMDSVVQWRAFTIVFGLLY